MSAQEPRASQPRVKVRAVLPCRIVTSRPDLYGGLAALIAEWGLPCHVVDIARALAEPVAEPGLDLLALDGEEARASLRQVLARRHAAGGPVVALVRRGRPRSVSLALALGCDDGIAFPLAEDELRLRLEALAGYALLVRELRLREQVCERWREPGAASATASPASEAGDVLLVGPPSPVQVELAEALPLRRVVFVRTPRTAAARIAEEPPLLVVVAATGDPEYHRPALDELVSAARRAAVTCLLAAPSEAVPALRALQLGFADRIAADDSPEELRLRLSFWLRRVQARRALLAQRRAAAAGPVVDPSTGLWSRAMLLDYLNRREAYPGGRERACVVLRLGGLEALAERAGHLRAERLVAACGARLGERVRAEDLVAHLGEGVFALVLPPTPAGEPEALAQRLVHELALPIPDGGGELLQVAAVCGKLARPADAPRTLERCVRDSTHQLRRAA